MTNYAECILKSGKEAVLLRKHPWLFSGAIQKISKGICEGDVVEIFSNAGEYLATGYYTGGSLAVKIISFVRREIDKDFWKEKLEEAFSIRKKSGLTDNDYTNAYRLVHSEGDGIPGIIIDFYNGTVVLQAHSAGIARVKDDICQALKEIYGGNLKAIYDKSSETLRKEIRDQNLITRDGYLFGERQNMQIRETGHLFNVDWEHGQKTGFFLDQRMNRMLAQFYARDKKVLNAFCYSGAFSVYCLKGGATGVTSVDSSVQAVEWTNENISINGINPATHKGIVADVKKFLTEADETYDMIILDPPAFAKHHNVTHNALQAYIHINAKAIEKLNPGGILFTFSCSQAITRDMFQSAVMSAAIRTGRDARILHRMSQGPDHPANLYHPEGEYLKGLVIAL